MSVFKHAPDSDRKKKHRKIEAERAKALKRLEELKKEKLSLQHDVFFVPGWTDEDATCWLEPYQTGYTTMNDWIKMVVLNPEKAHFITFSETESKKCESFLDFAEILKKHIDDTIGLSTPIDLVGHSMGGLDIVAAITQEPNPLLNVKTCITVATPHLGSDLGGLQFALNNVIERVPDYQAIQGKNLDPQEEPIIILNKLETRKTLLNRIEKLYTFTGTRDTATFGVARLCENDLDSTLYKEKVVDFHPIDGACHSSECCLYVQGITQDCRTIVNILDILSGKELDIQQGNYGYIFRA